ncbi:L,D-transpeptidase family protein [Bifidobacterium sp. ESL0790]|uniref:L,D-transpeptidase family protein n=1 Tax=Bifidobacterium sp. ESL0790 TaxID=2983233 RepID=UPI0023F9135C|nr:L,D-transpeptidase family protein [Bifidobacterium sp. ESL0790]WEV72199.1 L,D-transpeptidase family protein [Bifidobacterium sp. ESL0790]
MTEGYGEGEALTEEFSAAEVNALGEGMHAGPQKSKKKMAIIIAVAVLAVLIVAFVAAFFTARWYYQDKAAPGVTLGNVKVTGQNASQLKSTVNHEIKASTVTVRDAKGHKVKATLADLGVKPNVNQTVKDLLNAKSGNDLVKVNPFSKDHVPLAAQTNDLDMQSYLTKQFVASDKQAVPSTISFDGGRGVFVATEGRGGISPQSTPVKRSISTLIADPGQARNVSIGYKNIDMPVSVANANQAANEANRRLNNPIVINNGDAGSFNVPGPQLASWIKPNVNMGKGVITLNYDKQAIQSYANSEVPKQLNQDMVSQVDVVDDTGKVLATMTKGVNGVKVKDADSVANQVYKALSDAQPATIQSPADIAKFDVQQKKSEYRVVVDKSSQTVSVYKGDQVIRTFPVCTGASGGDETDSGNFFIYLKYRVQDMRGLNNDGSHYLSPGVKWVSYFNGGEGFHTASWNYGGIARGDPSNVGSHGCVNMYEADAEWIYDNCPEGTFVQVVGNQPSGPVR